MKSARDLLDFMLSQVAAECYFDTLNEAFDEQDNHYFELYQRGSNTTKYSLEQLRQQGEYSLTQATTFMWNDFKDSWDVLYQLPNTRSGFSATLLRNQQTGRYHIAFRGTESRQDNWGGDSSRDAHQGADGEISNYGFAIGQILDMEAFYSDLTAEGGLLAGNTDPITVSGYSLGGHLAQMFSILHYNAIESAYTINGAGFGEIKDAQYGIPSAARFRELLGQFDRIRTSPQDVLQWVDEPDRSRDLIELISDVLSGLGGSLTDTDEGLEAAVSDLEASHTAYLASDSAYSVYRDPFYQFAIQYVVKPQVTGTFYDGLLDRSDPTPRDEVPDSDGKIFNIYGQASHNDSQIVAASGQRLGAPLRVFIEDQPDVESLSALKEHWDQAKKSDYIDAVDGVARHFGATHSITLIIDSLYVADLIQRIDPSVELTTISDQLFAGASNTRSDGFLSNILGNGNAVETDSLDRVVNYLLHYFEVDLDDVVQPPGEGEFGEVDGYRKGFHAAVSQLQGAISSTITKPELQILDWRHPADIAAIAAQDTNAGRSYRFALEEVSPFALVAPDGYGAPSGDRYDRSEFSDRWILDRVKFISQCLRNNVADSDGVSSGFIVEGDGEGAVYYDVRLDRLLLGLTRTEMQQIAYTGDFLDQWNSTHTFPDSVRQVVFGTSAAESFVGGSKGDTIYGQAGDDILTGGNGGDYLDGGSGNDRLVAGDGDDYLVGGAGADSYVIATGEGSDVVSGDLAGDNIIVDGVTLDGSDLRRNSRNGAVFVDGDGNQYEYDESHRRLQIAFSLLGVLPGLRGVLTIDDYDPLTNNAGIALPDYNAPIAPDVSGFFHVDDGQIGGGVRLIESFAGRLDDPAQAPLNDERFEYYASRYYPDPSDPQEPNTAVFDGGNLDDYLVGKAWATGGWDPTSSLLALPGSPGAGEALVGDLIGGKDGNDTIFGYDVDIDLAETDLLIGGRGSDTLYGGGGNDLLFGQDEYKYLGAAIDSSREALLESPDDRDALYGGKGEDDLVGGSYGDTLVGGEGNDQIIGGSGGDLVEADAGDDVVFGDSYASFGVQVSDDIAAWGPDFIAADDGGFGTNRNYNADLQYNDFIDGGAGDDIIDGEIGDDYIAGGPGHNLIQGDRLNEAHYHYPDLPLGALSPYRPLPGELHGNDVIIGGDDVDEIDGNGGDDIIYGNGGNDRLRGDDSVLDGSFHGGDVVSGGDGDDFIEGSGGDDSLTGDAGNDVIWGDRAVDPDVGITAAWGAPNAGQLQWHGSDFLDGGDGSDVLIGGGRDDALHGGSGNDILYGDGGDGTELGAGYDGADLLFGEAGADTLYGSGGDDYLNGGAGQDQLFGGDGNDTLAGGEGYGDYLAGGQGGDTYLYHSGDSDDVIDDAAGANTLVLEDYNRDENLSIELSAGQEVWFLNDTDRVFLIGDTASHIDVYDGDGNSLARDSQFFNVIYGAGAQHVITGEKQDSISTGAGSDSVQSLGGPDEIWLGAGSDYADAGDGNDYIDAGASDDRVNGGGGDDTLVGSTGDDSLAGGLGDDVYLYADGDGFDRITDGGGDRDAIVLGYGINKDNLLLRKNVDNLVVENLGVPIFQVSYQYADGDHSVEEIDFSDGRSITADELEQVRHTGTVGDDWLDGTSGDDTLNGYAGNDQISGGDGDDYLDGGPGDDFLEGQGGDDTLVGRGGTNTVYGYDGADTIVAGTVGLQVVKIWDYAADVDGRYDTLQFVDGIAPEDITVRRYFIGGSYADDNVYTTNDVRLMLADGKTGVDLSDYLLVSDVTAYTVGNVVFDDGTSWDREALLQQMVTGSAGSDTIVGSDGADTIRGHAGDDVLLGVDGSDVYQFGVGDGSDIIRAESGASEIVFSSGVSLDTLGIQRLAQNLVIDYGSSDSVTLEGAFLQDGDGWQDGGLLSRITLDDAAISSNQVFNRISGINNAPTGGDDSAALMAGSTLRLHVDALLANDYDVDGDGLSIAGVQGALHGELVLDDDASEIVYTPLSDYIGNDAFQYLLSDGDRKTWVDVLLTVEAPVITGSAGDDVLAGTVLPDTLYGSDGDDTLNGGPGEDTLFGDAGADQLSGDDGADALYGGSGNDTLFVDADDVVFQGGDGTDFLYYSGSDGFDFSLGGTGVEFVSTDRNIASADRLDARGVDEFTALITNGGNDQLYAGDGGSWLIAGPGDDTATGGVGNDFLLGDTGADILAGMAGNDYIDGGDGNDSLDGGEGADSLRGGAGNDTLVTDGSDTVLDGGGGNDQLQYDGVEGFAFAAAGTGIESVVTNADYAADDVIDGRGSDTILHASLMGGDDTLYASPMGGWVALGDGSDHFIGGGGGDLAVGGNGMDNLDGGAGADYLGGGDGDDHLTGGADDDILSDGAGDDTLLGGSGSDTYYISSGNDIIDNADADDLSTDRVVMQNLASTDVTLFRSYGYFGLPGTDLIVENALTGGELVVRNFFADDAPYNAGAHSEIDALTFAADDIDLDAEQLRSAVLIGTDRADSIGDYAGDEMLQGQGGNDVVVAWGGGNDVLFGGTGDDWLVATSGNNGLDGGTGDDYLYGGSGNDVLTGGAGNDSYGFSAGGGDDTIDNHSASGATEEDVLTISGVAHDHLWFSADGSDLLVQVVGSDDSIRLAQWYEGSDYQVDEFDAGGMTLVDTSVQQLVDAMAAFDPPVGVEGYIPVDVREELQPVLASAWQPQA